MGRKGHFLMVKPSVTTEELRQSAQRHPHHWHPGFVRLFPRQGLHFESLLICLFPSCHNMPSRLVLKSFTPPPSSANSVLYFFMSQHHCWKPKQPESFAAVSVTHLTLPLIQHTPEHKYIFLILLILSCQTHPESPTVLQPHPQVIDTSL